MPKDKELARNADRATLRKMALKDALSFPIKDTNAETVEAPLKDVLLLTPQDPQQSPPSERQVGGDHYKNMVIEPSEFIYKNQLNWLVGNAIKYLCRYDKKNGKNDLDKAIHYIELLKEWRYERDD